MHSVSFKRFLSAAAVVVLMILQTAFVGPVVSVDAQSVRGDAPAPQAVVFSNPAPIAPADRASNNAGTNPGLPPLYPSPISVTGLTGVVSKITVTFAMTSTFPDDFDILLVGPTGARSLVISDAGGSGDPVNVTYTFDQDAATVFPDGPTTVVPAGTYRPANYVGLATPEPGGQDNFPAPGPGLTSYTADFTVFNGTDPNGTWNLFVVDDQVIDTMSLPTGWSVDITTIVLGPMARIAGQVTTAGGVGIRNARIVVSGGGLPQPRVAQTSSFGYYYVEGLPIPQTYTVTVFSKTHTFSNPQQVINLTADNNNVNFTAN